MRTARTARTLGMISPVVRVRPPITPPARTSASDPARPGKKQEPWPGPWLSHRGSFRPRATTLPMSPFPPSSRVQGEEAVVWKSLGVRFTPSRDFAAARLYLGCIAHRSRCGKGRTMRLILMAVLLGPLFAATAPAASGLVRVREDELLRVEVAGSGPTLGADPGAHGIGVRVPQDRRAPAGGRLSRGGDRAARDRRLVAAPGRRLLADRAGRPHKRRPAIAGCGPGGGGRPFGRGLDRDAPRAIAIRSGSPPSSRSTAVPPRPPARAASAVRCASRPCCASSARDACAGTSARRCASARPTRPG